MTADVQRGAADTPDASGASGAAPADRGTGNARTVMWTVLAMFVWVLSVAVPVLIVQALGGAAAKPGGARATQLALLVAPLIGIILGAGAFATVRFCGYTPVVLGVRWRGIAVERRAILLGVGVGLGLQIATAAVDLVLSRLGVHLDPLAPYKAGLGGGVVAVVFACTTLLTAPVGEELFFRGLLLGMATRHLPRGRIAWTQIVIVAVLFSLGHFNVDAAVQLVIVAVAFGWMRCREDSLVPSVAAHISLNLLPTIALLAGLNV